MSDDTKKVALPAYLLKRLQAFRIVSGDQTSYLLRDKLLSKTYDLEPWQFFLLEVLPGCDSYAKLASVFEDRFGRPISEAELRRLFAETADRKLFAADAESHPLLREFTRQGYEVVDGEAKARPFAAAAAPVAGQAQPAAPAVAPTAVPANAPNADAKAAQARTADDAEEAAADLPAGINEAVGFDPRTVRRMWVLFDPRGFLSATLPLVRPLRALVYLIPLMVVLALAVFLEAPQTFRQDVERLLGDVSFLQHLLFSMVTVNLLNTFLTAWTAHHYRATVSGIGIGLVFGFLPRFMPRVGHVKQLTRTEKMWLHASPLLSRLFTASGGLLVWALTRDGQGLLPTLALALAIISAIGLLFSANPLTRGSAYHLLAAFTNEPHLRGKAYKALLNRLGGKVYRQADGEILSAYAAATLLFAFVVIAVVLLLLAVWLTDLHLGGLAVVAVLAIGALLLSRTWKRFRKIDESYERSQQFERWRRRAVPEDVVKGEAAEPSKGGAWRYLRIGLLLVVLALLFLPYRYTPSGKFVVFPVQQVAVTSDVGGLITEVFSDGGERLAKGAPLARLATDDLQAEIDTLAARILQQEAVVADLRARPKREAVEVARRALEAARNQVAYSAERATRLASLHAVKAVTTEELEAARRQSREDVDKVAVREAELALARLGATPEEIAAAEAARQALMDEQAGLKQRADRAVLRMPIDGNVLTLRLGRKLNSYLPKGEPFAMVEDASVMSLELELPEGDLSYLREGAAVEVRASALFDEVYRGEVALIDRNVTARAFGNVVKVLVNVRNPDERLRTGMTGYAKVETTTMPAWKALSMSVLRFFQVHVWSWLP